MTNEEMMDEIPNWGLEKKRAHIFGKNCCTVEEFGRVGLYGRRRMIMDNQNAERKNT